MKLSKKSYKLVKYSSWQRYARSKIKDGHTTTNATTTTTTIPSR